MKSWWRPAVLAAALVVTLVLVLPDGASAAVQQSEGLASQRLGRGYWHVFIAYAVGWLLIFGWVISIARRLSSLESRVERP